MITNERSKKATAVGMWALLLWMVEPLLISEVSNMPLFQTLTIIFFVSFLPNAIRLTVLRKWYVVKGHSVFIWLMGVVCICGSDFAYILGAQCAPIAHIDIIDYMWPCFVVLFTTLLPNEKFSITPILGSILGFLGVCILFSDGHDQIVFNYSHVLGYALALYGAAIWAVYAVFSKLYEHVPSDMMSMYFIFGALLCFFAHLSLEKPVMPSISEWGALAMTGIGLGISYQLWDHAAKLGNVKLLSALSYAARILAIILLVWFDKQVVTKELICSVALAISGVFISTLESSNWHKCTRWLKGTYSQHTVQSKIN